MNGDLAFVKPLFIRSFVWAFLLVCFASVITGQGALAYVGCDMSADTTGCVELDNTTYPSFYVDDYMWTEIPGSLIDEHCHLVGHHFGGTNTWQVNFLKRDQSGYSSSLQDTAAPYYLPRDAVYNNGTYAQYELVQGAARCDGAHWLDVGFIRMYNTSGCTAPTAQFAADNVYTNKDQDVSFVGYLSTGSEPLTYLWDLDDVNYNTQNITHSFDTYGDYNVSLKVSNACGFDWENKTDYIHVQMFMNWTPTPTPTLTSIPWTNITTLNTSYAKEISYSNSTIGVFTEPWFNLWDYLIPYIGDMISIAHIIMNFPFNLINAQILEILSTADATFPEFQAFYEFPLLIVARFINIIPQPVMALITMGLIVDCVLLLWRGY